MPRIPSRKFAKRVVAGRVFDVSSDPAIRMRGAALSTTIVWRAAPGTRAALSGAVVQAPPPPTAGRIPRARERRQPASEHRLLLIEAKHPIDRACGRRPSPAERPVNFVQVTHGVGDRGMKSSYFFGLCVQSRREPSDFGSVRLQVHIAMAKRIFGDGKRRRTVRSHRRAAERLRLPSRSLRAWRARQRPVDARALEPLRRARGRWPRPDTRGSSLAVDLELLDAAVPQRQAHPNRISVEARQLRAIPDELTHPSRTSSVLYVPAAGALRIKKSVLPLAEDFALAVRLTADRVVAQNEP